MSQRYKHMMSVHEPVCMQLSDRHTHELGVAHLSTTHGTHSYGGVPRAPSHPLTCADTSACASRACTGHAVIQQAGFVCPDRPAPEPVNLRRTLRGQHLLRRVCMRRVCNLGSGGTAGCTKTWFVVVA